MTSMNKLQIHLTLREHMRLSEKRSTDNKANTAAKIFAALCAVFLVGYLVFISIGLAFIANSATTFTPSEFLAAILPVIIVIDFLFRIMLQRTPAQLVKPYLLLPLSKYTCTDAFIVSGLLTPNNFVWMFIFIPYSIMTILFSEGLLPTLSLIIVAQAIVTANSLFYMLCRTLWTEHTAWTLLPAVALAIIVSPIIYGGVCGEHFYDGFETFFDLYAKLGAATTECSLAVYLCIIVSLTVLFLINRKIQHAYLKSEATTQSDTKIKTISSFSIFNHFKLTGEYMKLELKSMLRNRNTRNSICRTIFSTVLLSLINTVITDKEVSFFSGLTGAAYPFMLICINQTKIMCYEGNYIECLFVHKENMKVLLRAKYYFYSCLLFLPLLLMLPTVISGHYQLMTLIAMMTFTAGPLYFLAMQMAVYNNTTQELNEKLTGKKPNKSDYVQLVAIILIIVMPATIMDFIEIIVGETATAIILTGIGIVFIAIHKKWIDNIYHRMMRRKYTNLEGFLISR